MDHGHDYDYELAVVIYPYTFPISMHPLDTYQCTLSIPLLNTPSPHISTHPLDIYLSSRWSWIWQTLSSKISSTKTPSRNTITCVRWPSPSACWSASSRSMRKHKRPLLTLLQVIDWSWIATYHQCILSVHINTFSRYQYTHSISTHPLNTY